jgi:hypothetical protein
LYISCKPSEKEKVMRKKILILAVAALPTIGMASDMYCNVNVSPGDAVGLFVPSGAVQQEAAIYSYGLSLTNEDFRKIEICSSTQSAEEEPVCSSSTAGSASRVSAKLSFKKRIITVDCWDL